MRVAGARAGYRHDLPVMEEQITISMEIATHGNLGGPERSLSFKMRTTDQLDRPPM